MDFKNSVLTAMSDERGWRMTNSDNLIFTSKEFKFRIEIYFDYDGDVYHKFFLDKIYLGTSDTYPRWFRKEYNRKYKEVLRPMLLKSKTFTFDMNESDNANV